MIDNKPMSPCKDCEKRTPGCHGKCEEYQTWAQEAKRLNEMANYDRAMTLRNPLAEIKTAAKHNRLKRMKSR